MVPRRLLATVAALAAAAVVFAEDAAPAPAEGGEEPAKSVVEGLTINMAAEVIDARTFSIRDTAKATKKMYIRLGNSALPEKAEGASDDEHQERVAAAKNALSQFVDKQMVFWKAGPDEAQPPVSADDDEDIEIIVGDAWTIDGRHINGILQKAGHLVKTEEYHSDLAKDILSAEADEKKREQYKLLEEALKEQQAAKDKEQEEEEEEDEEAGEGFGFGGWVGIGVFILLILGALTNFGRPPNKKRVNLNKPRSTFEIFLNKIKGQ